MKNQKTRRNCCFEDDNETSSSSYSDEARLDKAREENKFLKSLPNAETLSIRLLEFRSPRNFMRGVFRLELKTTTTVNATGETSYRLEMDGIKDPDASWPVYSFKVPKPQEDLLLNSLLPALAETSKKSMILQSLTLEGCGRIKGFHTSILKLFFRNEVNKAPNSLSILHWTDFCTNVDWDLAQDVLLTGLTQLQIEYGPKMEVETSEKLCNCLSPRLKKLHLKTGVFEENQSWLQWKQTFAKLTKLEDLSWVTHYDNQCQPLNPLLPETLDSLRDICEVWQSLPLRQLNLGLNYFDESLLRVLLLGHDCSLPLEDLSIHILNDDCGSTLGTFVQNNHQLRRLALTLPHHGEQDNENEIIGLRRFLERSSNHPALQELELNNVPPSYAEDDDVTALVRSLLSSEYTVLRDFSIALRSSISQEDLLLQTINLGLEEEKDPLCLQSLYRSIFAGLRDNNDTLLSLKFHNCEVTLDEDSCQTFHEALLSNSTLVHLNLGKCCVPKSCVSEMIVHELGHNNTLQQLDGMHFIDDNNQESLLSILEYNKNILHISPIEIRMLKKSSNAVDFYLKLNKAGRKNWIDHHFNAALMPHLLASASSDHNVLWYMLQTKTELIPREH